jgi:hypothetical protein
MLLHHDNARPHTSAMIESIGFEVAPHSPYCHLTSGCLQKEFISCAMRKFKLLWENGFENNLKSSTAMGSKNCSALAVLYRMRGRVCGKKKYRNKVCILSYILCFVSFQDVVKLQTRRHYSLHTLHSMVVTKCACCKPLSAADNNGQMLITHANPTRNSIFNLHVADRSILSSEWLENAARTSKH